MSRRLRRSSGLAQLQAQFEAITAVVHDGVFHRLPPGVENCAFPTQQWCAPLDVQHSGQPVIGDHRAQPFVGLIGDDAATVPNQFVERLADVVVQGQF